MADYCGEKTPSMHIRQLEWHLNQKKLLQFDGRANAVRDLLLRCAELCV